MKLSSRIVVAVCSLIAAATLGASAVGGGDLWIAVMEDVRNLNPNVATGVTEQTVIGLIYDVLVGYSDEGEFQPWLADRWEVSPDGLKIRFHLNPKAKWHDGKPVTAEDVVFSLMYPMEKRLVSRMMVLMNMSRAVVVDERTVDVHFKSKQVDNLRLVGTAMAIIPKHVWQNVNDPANFPNLDNPIGSGPFRVRKQAAGQYVILESTGAHFRANPRVDTLNFRLVRSEDVGVLSLKSGTVHMLGWSIDPSIATEVLGNPARYPNVKVARGELATTHTLLFNLRKAPYDNVEFRKAVAYAVNAENIVDATMMGFANPAGPSLVPPSAGKYYNPGIAGLAFSLDKARATLDVARFVDRNGDGWREMPDGSPLSMEILALNTRPSMDSGDIVANDLKKIGINARVTPLTPEARENKVKSADFDASLWSVSFTNLDMIFYYFHTSRGVVKDGKVVGFNRGGFSNATFDELAEKSRAEYDEAKRVKMFHEMQEIFARELPQVPLYHPIKLMLYRDDRFTGWVERPMSAIDNWDTFVNVHRR